MEDFLDLDPPGGCGYESIGQKFRSVKNLITKLNQREILSKNFFGQTLFPFILSGSEFYRQNKT